jgi:signal transduction histidine kinase
MNTNTSIKKQLLKYYLVVQIIILTLFGYILYNSLKQTTLNELQSTLKVIILDIKDDISEHNRIEDIELDENKEFDFEALFMRVVKINSTTTSIAKIKSTKYPKELTLNKEYLLNLKIDSIAFEYKYNYIIGYLKIEHKKDLYIIEVAKKQEKLNSIVENFIYILLLATPLILIISIILGNYIITKSFAPIDNLLYQIKQIKGESLSTRIDIKHSKDEIDLISIEINKLLQRMDDYFHKIEQFNYDVSHELKTPLTIIRGEIEVLLRKERSCDEYKHSVNESLQEILTLQKLIDDLLFLAKVDTTATTFEEVYLDELLLSTIKDIEKTAHLKNCTINCKIKDAITINGNELLIKILLKNIIENGIFYSEENSNVNITLFEKNNKKILEIEDFGIGMTQVELSNIYDKFYKSDKSRSQNPQSSGLGMSIVKNIAKIHHIDIDLQSQKNKGTKITLVF